MLTLGWLDEVTRGSNWKLMFDWRARLRIASVNGTSSITISGTASSGLAAAGGALVSTGALFSRAATGMAPSVDTGGCGVGVGASTAGVGVSGTGTAGAGVA